MVENNRLPDTPWHVGYAKKQRMIHGDIRRDAFTIVMDNVDGKQIIRVNA